MYIINYKNGVYCLLQIRETIFDICFMGNLRLFLL